MDALPDPGGICMQAYSQDLRERVLRAVVRGESPTEIARRFEVSRVWVYQVADRFKATGQRSSLPVGGYRVSRVADKEATLREWLEAEPDLTLAELCDRLSGQGVQIKVPALWHQLNKWNLSFKKNPARQRARTRRRAAGAA
jgi:transposase